MRYVDAGGVHKALDYTGLIEALRSIYLVGVDVVDRFHFDQPLEGGKQNTWILLPAWQYGKYQGIKLVSVFPDNNKRGLASVQGIYFLADGTSGVPIACFDGDALTVRRTACNSALASTYLSRSNSKVLLMVGAGNLAAHMISAHCTVRPIEKVLVWNRSAQGAHKLVAQMQLHNDQTEKPLYGKIEAVDDLKGACMEADIISCATMSNKPLILGANISAGCHLDLVGGYRPDMRESDDQAVRRARVFVDTRVSTIADCGDICQPIASGLLNEIDIVDLFQLVRGERPGRISADQITLFKSGGGGHEDLGTAQYLMSKLGGSSV
jgi:alanine dehydrogenase